MRSGSSLTVRGTFGKIFTSLFLLPFLGVGLWLTYQFLESFWYQLDSYTWPTLTCTIVASSVEENPGAPEADQAYIFHVRYRFEADGVEGSSEIYRPGYSGSSDIGSALRLARAYPVGAEVPCHVNPEDPQRSRLQLSSLWGFLAIFFPLIFVAVGGGGIFAIWWKGSIKPPRLKKSISSKAGGEAPAGCLAAFFSIFLLAGLGIMVPFFLLPMYQGWSASHWIETGCHIEYIEVRSHAGDDGSTYSVDVLFSYQIGGETYKSSRYSFFGGSDSDYSDKKAFVDAHPAGTETTCFVNPDEPLDAVLVRDNYGMAWFALIPGVFVLVGAAGLLWSLSMLRKRKVSKPDYGVSFPGVASLPDQSSGQLVLKASATPLTKLVTGVLIALFWNGITGIFVYFVAKGWYEGQGEGCLTIFLVPFVLIGLLLLVNIPYQFLAMFNPRPELTLDSRRIAVGSTVGFSWRFQGAARRIRHLRITLEGTEKVSYRRGTNTYSDSHTFATISIVDLARPHPLESGQAAITLPEGTMHSFSASNNKVIWKLKLNGEIRAWPDVAEEFDLEVTV